MREDPAYCLNQKDAQERWRHKNSGYWKTYREEHPEYTWQNREKQRFPNRLLRTMPVILSQCAKKEALRNRMERSPAGHLSQRLSPSLP